MISTNKTTNAITLMALMAAINIIFSLGAIYFPLAGFLLVIGLPLTSTLVVLFTKTKYYPIYFLATLGLGLVVSLGNIETTIFYLLPSLVSGFIFGFLLKHEIFSFYTIFIASIAELLMLYFSMALIDLVFAIDFQSWVLRLLNFDSGDNGILIFPLFLYSIALGQTAFSFSIISSEVVRFNVSVKSNPKNVVFFSIFVLFIFALLVLFGFFWLSGAYLLLGPIFLFSGFMLYSLIIKSKYMALGLAGGWIVGSVFVFAIISPLLEVEASLLPIAIFPLGVYIIYSIDNCFPKLFKHHKIEARGNHGRIS